MDKKLRFYPLIDPYLPSFTPVKRGEIRDMPAFPKSLNIAQFE
jgi:hypothetical protein